MSWVVHSTEENTAETKKDGGDGGGIESTGGTFFNRTADEGSSRQARDFGRGASFNDLRVNQHDKNTMGNIGLGNVC